MAIEFAAINIDKLKLRDFFFKTGVMINPLAMTPWEFRYYFAPKPISCAVEPPEVPGIAKATANNNERRAAKGLGPMVAVELIKQIEGR